MAATVYTIGHSTRPIEDFIALLKVYGIEIVVDVRTVARSRHNSQYNEADLADSLIRSNIAYNHLKGLGGLRHAEKNSINTAWKSLSFRGYADYMQTPEFKENLEELIRIAAEKPTAIMCAEIVPWRCHRSLIGDALLARNVPVKDIISEASCKPHRLTPFAQIDGNAVTYPAPSSFRVHYLFLRPQTCTDLPCNEAWPAESE